MTYLTKEWRRRRLTLSLFPYEYPMSSLWELIIQDYLIDCTVSKYTKWHQNYFGGGAKGGENRGKYVKKCARRVQNFDTFMLKWTNLD